MDTESLKRLIRETLREELKSGLFTARKLTDTPTDDLQVVNRKYTNLNGTTRPTSSVAVLGQRFFDTSVKTLITWDGTTWRNGVGSII